MSRFRSELQKASPVILTCLGIVGMIGTTITAVQATPKALQLIKRKKKELRTDELTPMELVQTTWQCYIPSALLGLGTVACIVGISVMDRRNQAALTSAYAMLNESYKQYRQTVDRVYGKNADDQIRAEMAKDIMVADNVWGLQVYNTDMDLESEPQLFYDLSSKKYFTTTIAAVLNAQYHANRNLMLKGECPLNEYLAFLGISGVDNGDKIGWDIDRLASYDLYWIDFDNRKTILDDGLECIVIDAVVLDKFE